MKSKMSLLFSKKKKSNWFQLFSHLGRSVLFFLLKSVPFKNCTCIYPYTEGTLSVYWNIRVNSYCCAKCLAKMDPSRNCRFKPMTSGKIINRASMQIQLAFATLCSAKCKKSMKKKQKEDEEEEEEDRRNASLIKKKVLLNVKILHTWMWFCLWRFKLVKLE